MDMEAAAQEFAYVAAQLTTDELKALDQRVVNGSIDGETYYSEDCGCFYGSIGIGRGIINDNTGWIELEEFRDILLENALPDGAQVDVDWETGITPLEDFVYYIERNATPETNSASAWLHEHLVAEIAQRDSPQASRATAAEDAGESV
jgi:hypothetical protein